MDTLKGYALLRLKVSSPEGFCKINAMKNLMQKQFGRADPYYRSNFMHLRLKITIHYPNYSLIQMRNSADFCKKMPVSMLEDTKSTPRKGSMSNIHDMPIHAIESGPCSSYNENESFATSYKIFSKSAGATDVNGIIDKDEGTRKELSVRSSITLPPPSRLLSIENDVEPLHFHQENGAVFRPDLQKSGSTTLEKRQINGKRASGGQMNLKTKRSMKIDTGIKIVEFLKNKRILITGSTGFLAKVLVEKILRVQPAIGQLYLLINANSTETAKQRLISEVQGSKLFQLMQEKYGKDFKYFMEAKLTAVAGDVSRDDLGLDKDVAAELANTIDIIVNSAANTTFDERYDIAVDVNTRGPLRLLQFGKKCAHLQLFLHLSTAFVNGQRRGRVPERPFQMGESIAKELLGDDVAPGVNVRHEIAIAQKALDDSNLLSLVDQTALMKRLGVKRAKLHGWQDTYVFTKVMGEMLIEESRAQIPVVILRPSVVESTLREPFSGWMEGLRMMDPILIGYGKGQINGFVADPRGVLDVVPADMVVNATLAAMAKHAQRPGSKIYQIASSLVNPLVFEKIAGISYEHFRSQPFIDQKGQPILVPKIRFFKSKDNLFVYNFLTTEFPRKMAKLLPWLKSDFSEKRLAYLNQATQKFRYLVDIYTPYTFYEGRFDIANTECLHQELSNEEKENFGFDVRAIDWDNYIERIHFPGLRKYPLKGRNVTTRL